MKEERSVMRPKKNMNKIKNEINRHPLKYKNSIIKEKDKEKYLGEMIHNGGLESSINATINDRKGRVKNAIFELNAIIEDTRMMVIGGALSAIKIWNMGIMPMMICNSETWNNINEEDLKELEDLQNLFFQILFQVPQSCPKIAGVWDTGSLLVEMTIMKRKINFAKYLKTQDSSSLSQQIFTEQEKLKFPGLVTEVDEIVKNLDIVEEYNDKNVKLKKFKNISKKKISSENEKQLRQRMKKYKKMDELKDEKFEIKDYLKSMNLNQIRSHFKYRTKMLKVKFNYKNVNAYSHSNWLCDSCEKAVDTQSHILWCPAYKNLREGKDINSDDDLMEYIGKVMTIREKLNLRR